VESVDAVQAATSRPDVPLVGRQRELDTLDESWNKARAGRGGVVLVTGDAGIGKSRLLEELSARVGATGGTVAWGRCHAESGVPAYWPWLQILRQVGGAAPDPADLSVEPDGAGGGASPERARRPVYEPLLHDLLAPAPAAERPLLLAVEDLHC